MSTDKRTVSTDALETLGMIHTRDEKRDAIHLAVLPAKAGAYLAAGWCVRLESGVAHACERDDPRAIGIVDPFLQRAANAGESFWLVIFPRVITSLRHVWSHPAIVDEPAVAVMPALTSIDPHETYLRDVADNFGLSLDGLLDRARAYVEYEDYAVDGGRWEGMGVGEDFWVHFDAYTKSVTPADKRHNFFSCSC